MRARLYLLLCAALARVFWTLFRTGFRNQNHGEARAAEITRGNLPKQPVETAGDCALWQYRLLPACRAQIANYARLPGSVFALSQSGGNYHEERADLARSGFIAGIGAAAIGACHHQRDDARS